MERYFSGGSSGRNLAEMNEKDFFLQKLTPFHSSKHKAIRPMISLPPKSFVSEKYFAAKRGFFLSVQKRFGAKKRKKY